MGSVEAVRVLARQQMPNYRKPASFLIKESYPLPPYSSVIGLVHNMCGWKRLHPMRVSVQGSFASTVNDYAVNYMFGGIKFDPSRHAFPVDVGGGRQEGITRRPVSYELLTDVRLLLHILPEDPTEAKEIAAALQDPPLYPSLGRYEDLLQIEEVGVVSLESPPESFAAKYDAYLPLALIPPETGSLSGTIYRLGKIFEYDNGKERTPLPGVKSTRVWREIVATRHIGASTMLEGAGGILYDSAYNEAVYPA